MINRRTTIRSYKESEQARHTPKPQTLGENLTTLAIPDDDNSSRPPLQQSGTHREDHLLGDYASSGTPTPANPI
jgi:hypothetical protein